MKPYKDIHISGIEPYRTFKMKIPKKKILNDYVCSELGAKKVLFPFFQQSPMTFITIYVSFFRKKVLKNQTFELGKFPKLD